MIEPTPPPDDHPWRRVSGPLTPRMPRRLTDDDVRAIREKHAAGERKMDLAVEYGVSAVMIGKIVRGDRYQWVQP